MVARTKKRKSTFGQAAIETALALPFLVWLLYYTINAFQMIHTAHIGQEFSTMSLYQRLDNRSKFVIDEEAEQLHGRDYMAVRYTDESGYPVQRNIIDSGNATEILTTVGICKEPICN